MSKKHYLHTVIKMDLNKEFKKLKRSYEDNDFEAIFKHEKGIYFLKLRSISRTALLQDLAKKISINIEGLQNNKLFEFIFCQDIEDSKINNFINEQYELERTERKEGEDNLYSQLYKLKVFDWGGFYQNSVEKTNEM